MTVLIKPPHLLLASFLYILLLQTAFAVHINTIKPTCVREPQMRLVSDSVQCPCFIRLQMQHDADTDTDIHPDSAMRLDYLAVRASDYDADTPLEELESYEEASGMGVTTDGGTYNSGDIEVKDTAKYIFLIRARPQQGKTDCVTTVRYVFESVPRPCTPTTTIASTTTTGNGISNNLIGNGIQNHIVGGRVVDDSDRIAESTAVILTKFGDCTAVAVAPYYLLTAAHCRVNLGGVVRVGARDTMDTTNTGTNHTIKRTILHPDFQTHSVSGLATADIALLQVHEEMYISPENAVSINANADNGRTAGQWVEATGYGRIAEGWSGTLRKPRELKTVALQVFSEDECKDSFKLGGAPRVADGIRGASHICAGMRYETASKHSCRADTCTGDSGGPLIARNTEAVTLVAITSGGLGCGRIGIPGIYTRVSTYAEWIHSATNGTVQLTYDAPPSPLPPPISMPPASDDSDGSTIRGSGRLRHWPWLVAAIAATAGVLVLAMTLVLFFVCQRGGHKVQTEFSGVSRDEGDNQDQRQGEEARTQDTTKNRTGTTTGRKSIGGFDFEV